MPAFLVRVEDVDGDVLCLRDTQVHHLRVRRLSVGDETEVIDGVGNVYRVRISLIRVDKVYCAILSRYGESTQEGVDLTLAVALMKGQRFDFVVEKATEIGVSKIVPMLTERGVVRFSSCNKRARWLRVCEAAAKQSGRSRLPDLLPPATFGEVVTEQELVAAELLMAAPGAGGHLPTVRCGSRLALLVGPEGGFTVEEEARAHQAGATLFSWGNHVLRADTAAIVLAALTLQEARRSVCR